MLSSPQIKHIKSLQQKKFRDSESLFIAETPKVVEDFLESDLFEIKAIYALQEWVESHWKRFAKFPITEVSPKELERISGLNTPNQVLCVIEKTDVKPEADKIFSDACLILDDIRDPGNLGTIIRIADWFGIKYIVCSNESVESTNPKCVQATMGSLARIQVFYTRLEDFIRQKPQNYPIYGTFMNGKSIYESKLNPVSGIVIGNEAHGISPNVEALITEKIHIPSFALNGKHAESLNASIATAVICSELKGHA